MGDFGFLDSENYIYPPLSIICMNRFNFWNNLIGWCIFAIALLVYICTLEPTVSFWDCGEFIASSYGLQVGHPPGAPLYLLATKVFSLLAIHPQNVAWFVNAFSALVSAFTILFLFWTITHFSRRLLQQTTLEQGNIILILGTGVVGALAYTFSDSFWFSAVEAEVYAFSSLFTAVVFWAILKWEEAAHLPYANKWLVLIAYFMGLSIGVHLLNLLAIPAISLVYYFKKFRVTLWGFVFALLVSFALLAFFQYGIIPGTIFLAAASELFFVNSLHFPFNTGVFIYLGILFLLLLSGIWLTYRYKKYILNTILLSVTFVIIGYSSYAIIVLRSLSGTNLNENQPDNVFSLLYYLNRDQYGDRPLFKGPYYNAPVDSIINTSTIYGRIDNRYDSIDCKTEYIFDKRFTTFFPRMYSRSASHIKVYKDWAGISGEPLTVKKGNKQEVEYKPSFIDNLEFFLKYQVGYMYFRYFMWNFAGKQNYNDGDGGILYGNAITGVPQIDNTAYGYQHLLPKELNEGKGSNRYYLLPLIFGIFGMLYQYRVHKRGFAVVLTLFLMTGIAIVVYLNQTPLQPRERDYAYVGSFYAFSIWIGLGVAALFNWFGRYNSKKWLLPSILSISFLSVPFLMAYQNWDDHDRSNRYIAHDIAYNYLNSCAPNSILFTVGDNDTFPLWYLQEVEGIRRDVRVVNMVLLGTDWYIRSIQKQYFNTPPVPTSFTSDNIRRGKLDVVYFCEDQDEYSDLKTALKMVRNGNSATKFVYKGDTLDCFNNRNFVLPIDTIEALANGTLLQEDVKNINLYIPFRISNSYIQKDELMLLDILAENNWERPIYFTSPSSVDIFGLRPYLRLEGFAYRLVPLTSENSDKHEVGSINSDILYRNLMDTFKWNPISNNILIDNHCQQMFRIVRYKTNFARLAEHLVTEGKTDSALNVINRYFEITPSGTLLPDVYSIKLAEACYKAGAMDKGDRVLQEYFDYCLAEIRYFYSLPPYLSQLISREKNLDLQLITRIKSVASEYGRKLK